MIIDRKNDEPDFNFDFPLFSAVAPLSPSEVLYMGNLLENYLSLLQFTFPGEIIAHGWCRGEFS